MIETVRRASVLTDLRPTAPLVRNSDPPLHYERGSDRIDVFPELPPYPTLPLSELAAARSRAGEATYPVRALRNADGSANEPISMVITGTRAEVVKAFTDAGWVVADTLDTWSGVKSIATALSALPVVNKIVDFHYDAAPVSDQFLDGKLSELAFEKNNVHDLGRDHFRVYDTGRTAPDGRPIWEVAATRDTGVEIRPKSHRSTHLSDHAIDGERDLLMSDLLHVGAVEDWDAAKGVPADGEEVADGYRTDGRVYRLSLLPHADLPSDYGKQAAGRLRQAIERSPAPIRSTLHRADAAITEILRKASG